MDFHDREGCAVYTNDAPNDAGCSFTRPEVSALLQAIAELGNAEPDDDMAKALDSAERKIRRFSAVEL